MGAAEGATGIAAQMEVEAFRRLFPVPFYDRHLSQLVRPDARTLDSARETTISLGPVASADASALVKIGETVSSSLLLSCSLLFRLLLISFI